MLIICSVYCICKFINCNKFHRKVYINNSDELYMEHMKYIYNLHLLCDVLKIFDIHRENQVIRV